MNDVDQHGSHAQNINKEQQMSRVSCSLGHCKRSHAPNILHTNHTVHTETCVDCVSKPALQVRGHSRQDGGSACSPGGLTLAPFLIRAFRDWAASCQGVIRGNETESFCTHTEQHTHHLHPQLRVNRSTECLLQQTASCLALT